MPVGVPVGAWEVQMRQIQGGVGVIVAVMGGIGVRVRVRVRVRAAVVFGPVFRRQQVREEKEAYWRACYRKACFTSSITSEFFFYLSVILLVPPLEGQHRPLNQKHYTHVLSGSSGAFNRIQIYIYK